VNSSSQYLKDTEERPVGCASQGGPGIEIVSVVACGRPFATAKKAATAAIPVEKCMLN
jgi:hypothetical protein